MSKFAITKKVNLSFLGEAWKESYLEFYALTIKDLRDSFPSLGNVDAKDAQSVSSGIDTTLKILQDKFIGGKGVDKDGNVVEITKEDLVELPAEIVPKVLNFLSEGLVTPESKQ